MTQTQRVMSVREGGSGSPSTEDVAAVVGDASTIGAACEAFRNAGWMSSIAGNRITINDRIFARFVDECVDATGLVEARWIVYETNDRPPMWVVGITRTV